MPRRPDPRDPDDRVVIRDFAGLVAHVDPHDLPPGAASLQVNALSWRPGELRVRPGYAVVSFDPE